MDYGFVLLIGRLGTLRILYEAGLMSKQSMTAGQNRLTPSLMWVM